MTDEQEKSIQVSFKVTILTWHKSTKKSVGLNTCATILTKNDQYRRCDETKAKGVWAGGGELWGND